ncbi:hypothetical protein NW760_014685 [Fusarium oxysporum]|uniref:Uncharacterized protein n=1 Tax=Fusarium oxysporum f. sp. pisi HDV247 TaxID=1080344 RepID=W9NXE6_FUSOX|nr:hypothetical protein FOVG_16336 [Fusarium oxysporum f. sp. pisi HDV247]KAJ4076797.1 hypothetical protein NW769_015327 [Fusarium oxysporum]KAJ4214536.1 hypothetical protein NW760_014685 [Fusarium oxysporum]WKT43844.1 hypothetical protein QSH57_008697 [Fusarium oxysporum f. sp. vasinfectum]
MVDSTRPRIFQPGYAYGSRLSPSKNLFMSGDSCDFLAEHKLRDCSHIGKYLHLSGSVNDSVGQYGANCCPLHGRGDDDSAMDLRGDSRTTPYNFIDSAPRFNESIGGEIQASTTGNYTNILPNSIPFAAGTPCIWKMLLDTTYPVAGGGFDYDFCTPPVQTIPDDLQSIMVEAGRPTNSVLEANSESLVMGNSGTWWQESSPCGPAAEQENLRKMQKLETRGLSNSYVLDIKSTTSKHQGQHIGEAEQASELWGDRNHINEAMRDLRNLEVRLHGWNKHQMVAVTSTG